MRIEIPEKAVIMLMGCTSSGKTSFGLKHFKKTEVLSSDAFREMIADNENDQSVTKDAFALLYHTARLRLKKGKRCVIDATNTQAFARRQVLKLAWSFDLPCIAIVLNVDENTLLERNRKREDRGYPDYVVERHFRELNESISVLGEEGFNSVYVLNGVEEIDRVEIIIS